MKKKIKMIKRKIISWSAERYADVFDKITDVKIVTGIIIIFLSGIIFVLIVCGLGYSGMKRMNSNMNNMYNNSVIRIANSTSMRSEFLDIILNENKAFQIFSNEYTNAIKLDDSKLQDYIKDYESANIDENERKYIALFKNQYADFMKLLEKINTSLGQGEKVSFNDRDELNGKTLSMLINLNNLRDYNLEQAKLLSADNNKVYSSNLALFFIIVILGLLIIIPISFFIINSIKKSSKELIDNLNTIATGDFTIVIEKEGTNEFSVIKKVLSSMINDISNILEKVKSNSTNLNSQSNFLAGASKDMTLSTESLAESVINMTEGANLQVQNLDAITNIMNEFGLELEKVVLDIEKIDINAKNIGVKAEDSGKNMENLNNSINALLQSFNRVIERISGFETKIYEINKITDIIKKISDQTNLLALNAAIEAARAGDAGRGFYVVADEIRKLAEKSKQSSDNINSIAKDLNEEAFEMVSVTDCMKVDLNKQVNIIENTVASFNEIVCEVNSIVPQIAEVDESAEKIKNEKDTIIHKIENSARIAESLMSDYEEVSSASQELNSFAASVANTADSLNIMTEEMILNTGRFKTACGQWNF